MGQARKRGSFDERRTQAIARLGEDKEVTIKRIRELMALTEATPVKETPPEK